MNNKGLLTGACLLAVAGVAVYQSWPSAADRETNKAVAGRILEARDLDKNVTAVIVSRDDMKSFEQFEEVAKFKCGHDDTCKISFWFKGTDVPTNLPMTDAQVAGEVFQYTKVAQNKFEQSLSRCNIIPKSATGGCL